MTRWIITAIVVGLVAYALIVRRSSPQPEPTRAAPRAEESTIRSSGPSTAPFVKGPSGPPPKK